MPKSFSIVTVLNEISPAGKRKPSSAAILLKFAFLYKIKMFNKQTLFQLKNSILRIKFNTAFEYWCSSP